MRKLLCLVGLLLAGVCFAAPPVLRYNWATTNLAPVIPPNTVNSNQLDAATRAMLGSGTGGTNSGDSSFATNSRFAFLATNVTAAVTNRWLADATNAGLAVVAAARLVTNGTVAPVTFNGYVTNQSLDAFDLTVQGSATFRGGLTVPNGTIQGAWTGSNGLYVASRTGLSSNNVTDGGLSTNNINAAELAGLGGAGAASGLGATNPVLYTTSGLLTVGTFQFTNSPSAGVATQAWMNIGTPGNGVGSGIHLSGADFEGGAQLEMRKPHGADPLGELIIACYNSIAISPAQGFSAVGNRALQIGIGNPYMWIYPQLQPMTNTAAYPKPGCNQLIQFTCGWWDAATNFWIGGGGADGCYPAVLGFGTGSNGQYVIRFYDTIDPHASSGTTHYLFESARPRLDIMGGGPTAPGGIDVRGRIVCERQTGSALASTSLDLSGPQLMDLAASSSAITLSTTNANGGTKVERHVWYIRSGSLTVAVTYPQWSTNGNMPASIPLGKMLRLELESSGAGETNVQVVSAQVLSDNTYSLDPDAQKFYDAVAVSNVAILVGADSFCKTMKLDTTWGKFTNHAGAVWLYAGTNGTSSKWNIISTNDYPITWSGTVSYTNGVTGDGSTGYGDTGWTCTTTNGTLCVFVKTNYVQTGTRDLCGSYYDPNSVFQAQRSSTSIGGCANGANLSFALPDTQFIGYSRDSATNCWIGKDAQFVASASVAGTPQSQHVYVCGRDVGGSLYTGSSSPSCSLIQCVAVTTNSLTSAEWATLRSAVIAFNSAMGR